MFRREFITFRGREEFKGKKKQAYSKILDAIPLKVVGEFRNFPDSRVL